MTSSTALVAAGSRLAVGSSRNSISGSRGERARERQPLLLAAGEPPRRPLGRARRGRRVEQFADARGAFGARRCRRPRARRRVGGGAAAQHHRPLEHDGAALRRRPARGRPRSRARAVGSISPWRCAAAWSCPSRSGRSARSARRARSVSETGRGSSRRARRSCTSSSTIGRSVNGRAHGHHPAYRSPARRTPQASALTMTTMVISTRPSPMRERQVALGGFQRDRGGHGAGEAVDVAADDDDRADLGGGPAEAGEQRGDKAEARVPDQRRDAAERADIHRGELVAIFGPEILDGLARQRGDDRRRPGWSGR